MEVFVQDFDEVVYSLQISEAVISGVYTDAEEETSVPPVHNLKVPELQYREIDMTQQRKQSYYRFVYSHMLLPLRSSYAWHHGQ